jgi:N-acetylmuramoyl-L-alanine amidase
MSALHFIERLSPNCDARTRAVDLVVLHYTGMQDRETALARLTDPAPVAGKFPGPWQDPKTAPDAPLARVSSHYVVAEDGTIYRVVAENLRAWHAGASSWEGEGDVNARAIGIEIVNGGHDFGLPDFPESQIVSVIALLKDILARNKLHASRVVAHSDIAPDRKLDPGEKFPWRRLAEAGVALWPSMPARSMETTSGEAISQVQQHLAAFGYSVSPTGAMDASTRNAIKAFQRRFRPALINGAPDDETTALLASLTSA